MSVRIVDVREVTKPIASPIRNAYIDFSKMTTSLVAVVTDMVRDGKPVVGYGFNSNGRYGQGGLIRERFAPRLLEADPDSLRDSTGDNLDPDKVWAALMANEKPGGHGERSVAVGTIDMAVWDAVAKIAGKPLFRLLAERHGRGADPRVFVYAAGGYYYPGKDLSALRGEMRGYLDRGYTVVKMKIGGAAIAQDRARIEAVLQEIGSQARLAVDANGRFDLETAIAYARMLRDPAPGFPAGWMGVPACNCSPCFLPLWACLSLRRCSGLSLRRLVLRIILHMQLHDQLRQVVAFAPAHFREANLQQPLGVCLRCQARQPEGQPAQVKIHFDLGLEAHRDGPRQPHQAAILAHVQHVPRQGSALRHQVQHGGRLPLFQRQHLVVALEFRTLRLFRGGRHRLKFLVLSRPINRGLRLNRERMLKYDDRAAHLRCRLRNGLLHHLGHAGVYQAGQQRCHLVSCPPGWMNEANPHRAVPGGPLGHAPDAEHHLLDGQNHLHGFQCSRGERPQGPQPAAAQAYVEHLAGNFVSLVNQAPRQTVQREALVHAPVTPACLAAGAGSLLAAG